MSKKVIGVSFILFASLLSNAQDQKVNKNKPASIALKASILNFKKTPLTEGLTVSTPAVGVQLFKGIAPRLDAVVNLDLSSLKYPYYVSSGQAKATSKGIYAAIDTRVHLKLASDDKALVPYGILGIGLAKDAANFTAYAPMGLGLQFKAKQGSFVHLFSTYNAEASKLTKMHMNYGLSYSFPLKLKEKKAIALPTAPVQADQDDDGVSNEIDECPERSGLLKYKGCPVPDEDGDGINDENDLCPNAEGTVKYRGCPVPDTDKDGVPDDQDTCPTLAGLSRYNGCAIPDTDKDGVNDELDQCPTIPGIAGNNGCEDLQPLLTTIAAALKFEIGQSTIASKSLQALDTVILVMTKYPQTSLTISGHTDNTGSRKINDRLSISRAKKVQTYLVKKGLAINRTSLVGMADTQPIADNATKKGRAQNRRVDLAIKY
ncbi:MAG: OmpA family protein [Sediminibacterium sp.]|jgi:outer membrane protein OmpA-like peptidoglycan-associated protein|nr:OmpA family protein [Sediminibacterium sp.]MBP6144907.1 OmpA family protein [Sediminibacterium sp.]MBP7939619.1 OmpA family protein [Sediminibacterium sp.]